MQQKTNKMKWHKITEDKKKQMKIFKAWTILKYLYIISDIFYKWIQIVQMNKLVNDANGKRNIFNTWKFKWNSSIFVPKFKLRTTQSFFI